MLLCLSANTWCDIIILEFSAINLFSMNVNFPLPFVNYTLQNKFSKQTFNEKTYATFAKSNY